MWGPYSMSQRNQSNNKIIFDNNQKNNSSNNSVFNSNANELNILYQTPIKQFENIHSSSNNNTSPFIFDFNHYFGNLWSSGKIPNNQLMQQQMILSPGQMNKDNLPFYKKSIERSYKLSPLSQIKDSNSNSNSISHSNNNNLNLNQNNINNNPVNYPNSINNPSNANELSKRNLNELFNNARNDKFLYDENKRRINNINNNPNINRTIIRHKNYNLQISRQFNYSSPCACAANVNKPKKIFECSGGSSLATNSTNRTVNKNKRFRKNNEQITMLKKFYDEHKHWSKIQIREISKKIGLKENKVYKWLWDQRNKEIKSTKFVVKKDNNNEENENN